MLGKGTAYTTPGNILSHLRGGRVVVRDVFTIAQNMWSDILGGWLSLLLLVGILALIFVLTQSGPAEMHTVLIRCRDIGLKLTMWSITLLVVILGSTELPREVYNETIFFLLTKPIMRYHIILGKLAGLLVVAHSYIIFQTVVSVLVMAIRGLGPDWGFILETLLIGARVTILASSVIMFSTVLPEFPTIFFSAAYLVMGFLVNLLDTLIVCGPFGLVTRIALRFLYYGAPNYSLFIPNRLVEAAVSWQYILGIAGYALIYTTLLTWLATWLFSRREFN